PGEGVDGLCVLGVVRPTGWIRELQRGVERIDVRVDSGFRILAQETAKRRVVVASARTDQSGGGIELVAGKRDRVFGDAARLRHAEHAVTYTTDGGARGVGEGRDAAHAIEKRVVAGTVTHDLVDAVREQSGDVRRPQCVAAVELVA